MIKKILCRLFGHKKWVLDGRNDHLICTRCGVVIDAHDLTGDEFIKAIRGSK